MRIRNATSDMPEVIMTPGLFVCMSKLRTLRLDTLSTVRLV